MAKAQETRNGGKPSKMTVMVLQLEGSDEMIQEGLKALQTVADKMSSPSRGATLPTIQNQRTSQISGTGEIVEAIQENDDFEVEDNDEVAEARKPRRKATFAIPNVVSSLDLNLAPTSFDTFFVEKGSPTTIADRYLVSAAWLREFAKIEEITHDHIFTIFKTYKWDGPKNWSQPFYDGRKEGQFKTGSQKGSWQIMSPGLSIVQKMRSSEKS